MVERQENPNNINIDPDPFTKDFNQKLNSAIHDEVKDVVIKGSTKFAACSLPLALSACNNFSPGSIHINLDGPSVYGHIAGVFCAVEEAFEKDDKKFLRKALSISLKYGAGFTAAHAVASNVESSRSWISSQNLPNTISLIPSAYVIYYETNLNQLFDGISNRFRKIPSEIIESRNQRDYQRKLKHLAKDAFVLNLNKKNAARTEAKDMGISLKELEEIHNADKKI